MDPSKPGLRFAAAVLLLVLAGLVPHAVPIGAGPGETRPATSSERPDEVEFARDVRPILSEQCFFCHGPDRETREAKLRLDRREEAFADRGGYSAIVPGKSEASELHRRITHPDDPMPPPDSGFELTRAEADVLRRWIDAGAHWEEHWSYVAPQRPPLPAVREATWPRNPIDDFVLARLEAAGLSPAPEATRESLIRRAALDLTGIPPTPEEVEAFLTDVEPGAYERMVELMFASPRYGEHMARSWLDVARYGDTHGLHLDNERVAWPYRDWVIGAFQHNLPFDRFTIEQLAGDLLPEPTTEQLVATGFGRCNVSSAEGGMIQEEYLVKYAFDRLETTATVWLGTTLLCARCHDHKYDPVSQEEYYGLLAFFAGAADAASDENAASPPPVLAVPSPEQQRQLDLQDARIAEREAELEAPMPETDAAEAAWRDEWHARLKGRWEPLEVLTFESTGGAELRLLEDGSLLATGEHPEREVYELLVRTPLDSVTALRLEALRHESLTSGSVGRAEHGNIVLSELELHAAPASSSGELREVPLAAATADYSQKGFSVTRAVDGDPLTGWAIDGLPEDRVAVFALADPLEHEGGSLLRVRLRFESDYLRHAIGRFRLSASGAPELRAARPGPWHVLGPFAAADGDAALDTDFGPESGVDLTAAHGESELRWVERADLEDGAVHALVGERCATYAFRTIDCPGERWLTLSLGSDDALSVWWNEEQVLERRVARAHAPDQERLVVRARPGENRLLLKVVNYTGEYAFSARTAEEDLGGLPIAVAEAIAPEGTVDDAGRSDAVRRHFRRTRSPEWRELADELELWRGERAAIDAEVPRTLVMGELEEPRPTHFLERGQYDRKGHEVPPATPAFLPALRIEDGRRPNRLDLARWLVSREHPLTSRVTANRLWQELFGAGLVTTPEDFGSRGAWPTHPELLDWLAVELVESGWDVRHLLRLMVTSGTYRQAARTTPELRAADPDNRLLSRGTRFRLDAERIRDQALALSGLLVERVGGPSVKPYQPEGVWEAVAYTSSNTANYVVDAGEALHRRSLYSYWKRTAPPPALQLFDAPTRESCTLSRARTNTPLQALALLNDEQLVEAARAYAERALREGGASDEERVAWAFRTATARRPDAAEVDVLLALLHDQREEYREAPERALALLEVGDTQPSQELDPIELAAWTHVTQLLLNLDEVLTRG